MIRYQVGKAAKLLIGIMVVAAVSGNHVQQNQYNGQLPKPRLCNAVDESSEENCEPTEQPLVGPLGWEIPWIPKKTKSFNVKYLIYKNPANPDEYQEIFLDDRASVENARPYPKNQAMWKILAHGYTNNKDSQFPVNVKKAYLEHLRLHPEEPLNLLVFDWGDGAKKDWEALPERGLYQNAVENVQIAGEKLGDMIVYLKKEGFLDITTGVHLIGHSLGSHVAGQAARRVYNQTNSLIWRISGLDPAGPLFSRDRMLAWLHEPYPRLMRNRVTFLDVYHSSKRYGIGQEMGDVDFYINGGLSQPSCNNHLSYINRQSCSHQFAPEVFAKSINNKTMRACTGCYSYAEYHQRKCICEDEPILGEYVYLENLDGYPLASGQAYYDIDKL